MGRVEIVAGYPFALDRFQLEAFDALDAGHHVVVAAPTGSGKTVVAEYGIETTLRDGRRAFYTAPLKALSNQKFRDLGERLGAGQVGLLTGDNSINGDAPVVVMTTEVLRNMIYARSPALDRLGLVVLDEVHYLQDTYRGPVWEEVIVHLPGHVRLVCLSATVSNSGELAAWIQTVRGPTTPVVELRRPVRLHDRYLVGDRTNDRLHLLETFDGGRANPEAARLDASAVRHGRLSRHQRPARGSGRRVLYAPGRVETVDLLEQRQLLPAIVFIFSRNQCDEAARTCLAAGMRLTTGVERDRIREIVEARLEGLADDDLGILGYGQFLAQLEAGIAAHHAGMVPAFKEAVEACFIEGLIKVVFATETLAVGVNMPARTVVIEKLTKFTGDRHETADRGGVHPTHRPGRPAGDRRGRPSRRPVEPFRPVRAGRRARRQPDVPPPLGLPPDVQHGGEPGRRVHPRAGPSSAQPLLRAVPGRPRRRPSRGAARAGPGEPGRGPPTGGEPARRHLGLPAGGRGDARPPPGSQRHGGGRSRAVASGRDRPRRQGPLPRAGRGGRQRPPQGWAAPHHRDQARRAVAPDRRRLRRRPAPRRHDPAPGDVQPQPGRVPPGGRPSPRPGEARVVAPGGGGADHGGPASRRGGPRSPHADARRRADRTVGAGADRAERARRGSQPLVGPRLRPGARRPVPTGLRRGRSRRGPTATSGT